MPRISNTTPVLLTKATMRTPKMLSIVVLRSTITAVLRWASRVLGMLMPRVVEQRDENERDGRHDRRDGEHSRKKVDPAGEPGVGSVREVLGPLVDGARNREVRAHLGEVQPDQ